MTEITLANRAAVALKSNDEELKTLAEQSKNIVELNNPDAYKECHAARMALRSTRTDIEKRGKVAREDAQAFSKAIIAEEKRLIGFIEPEEQRLKVLQDAWDEREEAEKQAKIKAEQDRINLINQKIESLQPNLKFGDSREQISQRIAQINEVVIDASFAEFEEKAQVIKEMSIQTLTNALSHAKQIEEQAAENARLRKMAEASEAEKAAKLAEVEAKIQQAEEAKTAIQEPLKPEPLTVKTSSPVAQQVRPSDIEMIEVLALHFRVHESKVVTWLLDMDLRTASEKLVA
jgi:hypothetical protein